MHSNDDVTHSRDNDDDGAPVITRARTELGQSSPCWSTKQTRLMVARDLIYDEPSRSSKAAINTFPQLTRALHTRTAQPLALTDQQRRLSTGNRLPCPGTITNVWLLLLLQVPRKKSVCENWGTLAQYRLASRPERGQERAWICLWSSICSLFRRTSYYSSPNLAYNHP